jgi:tRNA threonylcarbamoyladenosine biosynthesis protein TsaE
VFHREVTCSGVEETLKLASRIGESLRGGETLALEGDLGSGKTTFTRGLAIGLGVPDPRLVSSPTYVLEQVYPARLSIHHYDAYRLGSEEEFLALGFEEQIEQRAVLVIEWADRVSRVLPRDSLRLEFLMPADPLLSEERRIRISGPSVPWEARLSRVLSGA